jgi:hypothetical protein
MSRPAGPARCAALNALQSGWRGDYRALAALVGLRPQVARATLKELGRVKRACACGGAGAQPAVYGAYSPPMDALGFARQVWR